MTPPRHIDGPSLTRRAVLAVLLLVGFYALGLAIAGGLLSIPYAMWRFGESNGRIALFCIIGAAIILWSLLPRFDRFTPPGPTLTPARQPELFATLRDVAAATNQEMPAEVYLIGDLNAWVMQRGGMMGMGSRRVMGLGLPLMQCLNVTEFKGVVAHEFGHYHGGDTALGPWIYRTRGGIGRTLQNLANHSELLMKPFEWYGNAFLRITHGISRQQEYVADAVAAGVVGPAAMVSGLQAIHAHAEAYNGYWYSEFVPALSSGFRPPLLQGFSHFLAVPSIAGRVKTELAEAMAATEPADPFDTHPALPERVSALQRAAAKEVESDTRSATALLRDVPKLEAELIASLTKPGTIMTEVAWDDMPARVMVPSWQRTQATHLAHITGMKVADLARFAGKREALIAHVKLQVPNGVTVDQVLGSTGSLAGALIAAALVDARWTVTGMPGDPIVFSLNGVSCEPFQMGDALFAAGMTPEQWSARDDVARIGHLPLATGELVRAQGGA